MAFCALSCARSGQLSSSSIHAELEAGPSSTSYCPCGCVCSTVRGAVQCAVQHGVQHAVQTVCWALRREAGKGRDRWGADGLGAEVGCLVQLRALTVQLHALA